MAGACWPNWLTAGEISPAVAADHPFLRLVGLVGSIDNDMAGTDMTIGADTALHRIVEAMDALRSTASSHQRTFVVEVMGRHCGYLALMASLATRGELVDDPGATAAGGLGTADVPGHRSRPGHRPSAKRGHRRRGRPGPQTATRSPPTRSGQSWKRNSARTPGSRFWATCNAAGHRAPSTDTSPRCSAHAAVERLLTDEPDAPAQLIGLGGNRVVTSPLMDCVAQTQAVAERIKAQDFDGAMLLRGGSFRESYQILRTVQQAAPRPTPAGRRRFRLAVVHGGGPAPGMNNAVRAAVRLGLDRGYTVLAVKNGFRGLRDGDIQEMGWMDVSGWVSDGGAEIGTNRYVPSGAAIAQIAKQVAAHRINGLLMAGGWAGYQAAHELHRHRQHYAALDIPIVCLPMTINNDVPGTELSIGSDTALNSIVADVDKIRQSAVATRRVFVVEVMGRDCGYLALLSGLATGAERIYLPEEGITLDDLTADVHALADGFRSGKRLGLIIRNENADPVYTTGFITSLFQKEGGELFDARQAILGHVQEGGDPSPFDRIQATRLTARCIEFLSEQLESGARASAMIGFQSGRLQFTDLTSYPTLIEHDVQRPLEQRWMDRRGLAKIMRG